MRDLSATQRQQRQSRDARTVGYLGAPAYPSGRRLRLPGGQRSFDVQHANDSSLVFITVYESASGHPHAREFAQHETWIEVFYAAMASVLDL